MASYTWNTLNGSFATASNWSPAVVPGASDTAIFGASTGTISGTGTVAQLNFLSGGAWSLSGQVQSGGISALDTVTVLNGGVLTATSGVFGVANAVNATGSLVINAGGTVRSTVPAQTSLNQLTVANMTGSTGSVTVSGAGALLDVGANTAGVGNSGTGSLVVSGGGTARFSSSNSDLLSALSTGSLSSGRATIQVSGTGSTLTAAGYVYIGRAGTASLLVSGGGIFTGGQAATSTVGFAALVIGDGTAATVNGVVTASPNFGGSGAATVTGAGSQLRSLSQLRVGYRGSSGTLLVDQLGTVRADTNIVIGGGGDRTGGTGTVTVQGGSTVIAGGTHAANSAGIVLGNDVGTTGQVTVTGAGSTLNANGDRLTVGGNGTGSLTISGGGRALSGSAGYAAVEAALSVAAGSAATGSVTITGTGSQLVASGDGVIGGNERAGALAKGGTATVSVSSGGSLSVSGTLTVQAAGTLTVDSSSTLTTPRIAINGGKATLGTLAGSTAISFGAGGTLAVSAVSGSHAVSGFTFGDTIDLVGTTNATLAGNTVTTSAGSLALNAAAANTSYQLLSDGNGGTLVALTPQTIGVYRFFDSTYGTHFYTASAEEAKSARLRADLVPEGPGGVGLQAVAVSASDPNAVAVYRFFDNVYGTHFFTADAVERDTVIATRSDLVYEESSVFYEHATQQAGDVAVYRFFDNVKGTHFYTDDPAERAAIIANRSDLIAEGIGFYEPKQNYAA